jgi:prepilin-type N-terminal cleavage/methylation domain-containing protein
MKQPYNQYNQVKGFTLAELLITVGLIGLIAAITMPDVWSGARASNRRAVFKDTLKIITEAAEALTMQGEVPADTYAAMVARIRVLERNDTTKIIRLHNGATLGSFNNACAERGESIAIDLEGRGRQGVTDNNVVWVIANWAPDNILACDGMTSTPGAFTGGMVKPAVRADMPDNLATYIELTR